MVGDPRSCPESVLKEPPKQSARPELPSATQQTCVACGSFL